MVILSNKYILDTAGFRVFQNLPVALGAVLTFISGYRMSNYHLNRVGRTSRLTRHILLSRHVDMLAPLFLLGRNPCSGTNDKASGWPKENQNDGPNVLADHCANRDFVQVSLKLCLSERQRLA